MPFPSQVNVQPAPAVAGDFASTNPRAAVLAGPGGLVTGPAGVTVGRFAWATDLQIDADSAPASVSNFGTNLPTGFVHREQQGLITTFLAESSMVIPQGFPVTLMNAGDFWAINAGATTALPGMYAFANFADGRLTFAAGTQATIGTGNAALAAALTGSIGAGTTSFTGSITGGVLTVTGSIVPANGIVIGGTITGGTIVAGTQIIGQLTGSAGGVGTYAVNIAEQTVIAGTAITETFATLNVSAVTSGTLGVGDIIVNVGGTATAVGTTITALGTGSGGAGTYTLNITQSMGASSFTAQVNVQTKFVCMSQGLAGELVKISSWVFG